MPEIEPKEAAAGRPAGPDKSSRWPLLGLAVVVVVHLALLAYFAPLEVMLSDRPLADIDYPLHYYQVDRARQAWQGWGALWGYDPLQLAGHPIGALEDLSSKSLELFVVGMIKLGLHQAGAFKLYVLLVHLLLPFVGFVAARLFRLTRWQAVAVAGFWVLLWFFDSFMHWLWFCGMISWGAASYLIVLQVALLYRTLGPRGADRPWLWFAVALVTSLLALLHPYASLTLIAPCLWLYLRDLRRLPWVHHVALVLTLCAALATALIWLIPALRMTHYLIDETAFLYPGPLYLLWDYLDLMIDDLQTGPPVRTMLRVLAFAAGAVCLYRWRKEGERRLAPLFVLSVFAIFLAYFGRFIPKIEMSQPYRHIGPAMLAAAIPAVVLLSGLLRLSSLRAMGRPAQLLLGLALLLIVPRFVHNALYYFPELLPEVPKPKPLQKRQPNALVGFVENRPYAFKHNNPPKVVEELRDWLRLHLKGQGRVLVQQFMLGEHLAAISDLPLLSGIEQRGIYHGDAYLFRINEDGFLPGKALNRYLERYAVRFVLVTDVKPRLEWRKDVLKLRRMIGPVRIYETKIKPSYFLRGQGRITKQGFNRIVVDDARGPDLVLRFHWFEGLRCRPGCQLEQFDLQGDRVGFIRVKNPPRRFEIYNSYRFDGPRWRPPALVNTSGAKRTMR
jgi:hypothetical protein